MNKIELILLAGESFFIFFLFFYLLYRDKVFGKKFMGLELALEEMHQEIFKLKKELEKLKSKDKNGV